MCGSTDLIKHEGVFACQSCGCKYSVEEAKRMMVEGTVEVTGTVKVDHSDSVKNYLDVAKTALLGGNGKEAFDYANKALEINPKSYEAWTIKMKSLESLGTIGDPRITEVLSSGGNAIEFAPPNKMGEAKKEVYGYYLSRALDLLQIATAQIKDVASIRQTFQAFALASVFTAGNNTLNADSGFVNLIDELANNALALKVTVPVKEIEDDDDFQKLVRSIGNQYQSYSNGLEERYKVYGAKLTSEAKRARQKILQAFKNGLLTESERLKRRKEEKERKKQAVEKQYFEQHPDVEQTISQKRAIIAQLTSQFDEIKKSIGQLEEQVRRERQKIKETERDITALEESIEKNKKKIFRKDKALQAAHEAENEVESKKATIANSEAIISSHKNDILVKKQEISKLNDAIKPEQQYIDSIIMEIHQGID